MLHIVHIGSHVHTVDSGAFDLNSLHLVGCVVVVYITVVLLLLDLLH